MRCPRSLGMTVEHAVHLLAFATPWKTLRIAAEGFISGSLGYVRIEENTVVTTMLICSILHDLPRAAGIVSARVKGRRSGAKPPLRQEVRMRHAVLFSFLFLLLPFLTFQDLVPVVRRRS